MSTPADLLFLVSFHVLNLNCLLFASVNFLIKLQLLLLSLEQLVLHTPAYYSLNLNKLQTNYLQIFWHLRNQRENIFLPLDCFQRVVY